MAKTKTLFDKIDRQILSLDELRELNRELSFRPASPEGATTLTAEQVGAFNRDGYLLPLPLFDTQQIDEYRTLFDGLLEAVLAEGGDSLSVLDPQLEHARMYDLMFEPRLVAYLKDLIGPNVVCWGLLYFCKLPHDDKQVSWHQDAYYWPFEKSRTVTVWLAIDDADHDNGCMQFVAGSHLHGGIEHRISGQEEKNALRFTVDGVEARGPTVDVALAAGQLSLHSDLLLHGSGANASDRRRCGLTMRYIDADVGNYADWHKNGVLVCGEDARGLWGNPPRPESD